MENLFNDGGSTGGPNKGMFVKIEREKIGERLKWLNLLIVINKYLFLSHGLPSRGILFSDFQANGRWQ